MVYPTFDISSIKERCSADIKSFTSTNKKTDGTNETNETGLNLVIDRIELTSKSQLDSAIGPIVRYIDTNLEGKDYVDKISHKPGPEQNQLWIARTYLFYQLLIFETAILQNETLYNEIFFDKSEYPFRPDIIDELTNFKMGIFGSITPTSDIDVGIQYSGTTLTNPGLAYIVSRFESLFVIFTGKINGSLAFDIETYADMLTLPNTGADKSTYPDYFYLDSSTFTEQNFNDMLVCAGKSIVRNVILAYKDTQQEINLDSLTFNLVKNYEKFSNLDDLIGSDIATLLSNPDWFNNARTDVDAFLKMSYEQQRYAYYKKVNNAEIKKFENTKNLASLNSNIICEIMILIGNADTYRMESYICSPTIVHVVRILQAAKDKREKYATLIPKEYCKNEIQHLDPFCSIGKYGYALSLLEQMGYIYRFYLTYCKRETGHYNAAKCSKKEEKYMDRYNDAILHIQKYLGDQLSGPGPGPGPGPGGMKCKNHKRKSKHRKTRNKRTKKTRRHRKHTKY